MLYVRKTGKHLRERLVERMRDVKNNTQNKRVPTHLNSANHFLSRINVCGLHITADKDTRITKNSNYIEFPRYLRVSRPFFFVKIRVASEVKTAQKLSRHNKTFTNINAFGTNGIDRKIQFNSIFSYYSQSIAHLL